MDIISYLSKKNNINLNKQQQQGVMSYEKNTLLLAVPGSGKTTVLVARIANLMVNHNISKNNILTLTYNKETAKDMRYRFENLFSDIVDDIPHFATIHSFCLSVMKYYSKLYNRPMPNIIEQSKYANTKSRALREIYKHYNDEYISEDNYDTLERLICYAKNMMLTDEQLENKSFEIKNFSKIYKDYENFKRKNHFIDFDDMLTLTYDILNKFEKILNYFQSHYNYINIDEAQDTSFVQHKIIELLSKKCKIFMVGDEDQSIYSFRGAYPQALLQFEKNYSDSLIIKMEQNFRSNSDIVSSANEFIKQNKQRYQKEMYCDNNKNNSIEYVRIDDYSDQAKSVLKFIKDYPNDKTLGVIYKNNESAIPLINLFYKNDISFYIKEHRITYFSSFVMRDIVAYMKIAIDNNDIDAFSQIYYKLGYSKGVFEFVKDNLEYYDSIFETVLKVSSLSDYKRNQTKMFINQFPKMLRKSPASAIGFIQNNLNYNSYIENRMEDGFTKTNTYQKLNTAKALSAGLKDIYEFLDKSLELQQDMQNARNIDKQSNIVLTTMHSSKGLEFDTVIILDAIKDIIPSSDAVNEKLLGHLNDYENETRLFYVAITRAKSNLIIYRSNLINGVSALSSPFVNKLMELDPSRNVSTNNLLMADVEHNFYGKGKVLDCNGDIITVDFIKAGEKTLSLSACKENNLLCIVK